MCVACYVARMVSESERDAMRNGRICVMTLGNGESSRRGE